MGNLPRPPDSSPPSVLFWPVGPHTFCVWLDTSPDPTTMHAGPISAVGAPVAACGAQLASPLAMFRAGQFNLATVVAWPPMVRWEMEFHYGPRPDQLIPPLLRCGTCYRMAQ